MNVSASVFKAYDIRGIFPDEINEESAEHLGKAFGTHLVKMGLNKCVIGRDDRESSPLISEKVIKGLTSTGCVVTDVGLTLSPLIHFYTSVSDFDAGINITASHNPKKYTGMKFEFRFAVPFAGDNLKKLGEIIRKGEYATGEGSVVQKDLLYLYKDYLKSRFKFSKPKIVIACGSGVTSIVAPDIFRDLGCSEELLECTLDSSFPNGTPDPESNEYMQRVRKSVLDSGAQIGFGFDADGDRMGVVDADGRIYKNDEILLLLATYFLKKQPGATVLYDIKCSDVVESVIKNLGGVPKMLRTGRTFFLDEMKSGAILGGELSGHTYIGGDYFGFDDGIYTALVILKILEESGKPLAVLMQGFPTRANTPEIKIPILDKDKNRVFEMLKERVMNSSDYKKVITLDGVKAYISDTGWFLVRPSNTASYLSVRMEGKDAAELAEINTHTEKLFSLLKI